MLDNQDNERSMVGVKKYKRIQKKSCRGHGCLSLVNVVFSGRGLCDGPIVRAEESC